MPEYLPATKELRDEPRVACWTVAMLILSTMLLVASAAALTIDFFPDIVFDQNPPSPPAVPFSTVDTWLIKTDVPVIVPG